MLNNTRKKINCLRHKFVLYRNENVCTLANG